MSNPIFIFDVDVPDPLFTVPAQDLIFGNQDVEAGSVGHWMFGPDAASLYGINGPKLSQQGAAPAFGATFTRLNFAPGDALVTPYVPEDGAPLTYVSVFTQSGTIENPSPIMGVLSAGDGYLLYIRGNGQLTANIGGVTVTSTLDVPVGVPTFCAMAIEFGPPISTVTLYVDGQSETFNPDLTGVTAAGLATYVGNGSFGDEATPGYADHHEAIILPIAATVGQLDAIYAASITRNVARSVALGG